MEKLTTSQRAEFDNIAKNQPVFAGNLQSHQSAQELIDNGFVMRYEGDYVLTNKGIELKQKIEGAFDIMCAGVLYKPKGCKMNKNYREGCGKCGTGHLEICDNK